MILRRLCVTCIFVSISLIVRSTVLGATVSKRSLSNLENHGEGLVESYVMARGTLQELIDLGRIPDPNGDEMEFLSSWRERLRSWSELSLEDLKMILKGDPGVEGEAKRSMTKRTIEANPSKRWTGGIVPFIYTDDIAADHKTETQRAMDHYHRFSCIRFVPWENVNGTITNEKFGLNHPGYLIFVDKENGC